MRGNWRHLFAAAGMVAGLSACADEAGVCDGTSIEVRPPLADPIADTTITCTGDLTSLCARPVVRLDDSRCDTPVVELATADRDDLFVGLRLEMADGGIREILAAAHADGNSQPVESGWVQLYEGSLADPDQLSGELSLEMVDGAAVAGRFSALTNPPR